MSVYDSIISRTPIDKGWSDDRKYCAITDAGLKFLLRISSVEKREKRKQIYDRICTIATLNISMAQPVEYGICDEGVYTLESFIDGVDAENFIIESSNEKQYTYGFEAGRILTKLHSIPAPADNQEWDHLFNKKIDQKIATYESCELKYESGNLFLDYIADNRHLLKKRPQTYRHGDYQIGNMMVNESGILTIIDFEYADYGDPWEDFKRIVWCAQTSPYFASGMVDGYFHNEVPYNFWRLLALYICSSAIGTLPWVKHLKDETIKEAMNQASQILEWYDNMQEIVPIWYRQKLLDKIEYSARYSVTRQ